MSAKHEITQAVCTDLPDAIELIEEAERLLKEARFDTIRLMNQRATMLAKIRLQTESKGT